MGAFAFGCPDTRHALPLPPRSRIPHDFSTDAAALRDEMKALRDENAGLEKDVATLKTQNKAIVEQNAQLVKEMKALKALVMKMASKR